MASHKQQQHAYGSIFNEQHQTRSNEPKANGPKKKRNLPGTPDPDADVIALSPGTLMATNRFVCEICNKGFQRDQNLQLHRRGHDLPWKLKQRTSSTETRKRVYICPETSCIHHHPSRALGDLTGIKKHFYRKHGEKKWKCDKCSKKYAVMSDWKAHYKTCGTREYRCDCGIVFSRRDSFITHRAFCEALAEESAKYCASNMHAVETLSLNSNLANSLFHQSETVVFPGGPNIFERMSGKTDAQAFQGCSENVHVIADAGCSSADDHRLPVIPDGQKDGIFQENSYTRDQVQLSAMEQQIYHSKDGAPKISLTCYVATDLRNGEGEALSSRFELQNFHSSLTRRSLPCVNGSKDSELSVPITLASKIYFSEPLSTFPELNSNGLNSLYQHEHLDLNESRIQMNAINKSEVSVNFPAEIGLPPIGSREYGGNQSGSFIKCPSIQPSRSHSSATALLQKAEQMGARLSNSDLFNAFDENQGTGTNVFRSDLTNSSNRRIPFDEKCRKEYSASTLSTICTGDTRQFKFNSWRLPEERRTPTYCNEMSAKPEYGVWKHLNRCTKTVDEPYEKLEKDSDYAKLDINCGASGLVGEEFQLAPFQHNSDVRDPFTRDFLGMTRKTSGMTSSLVSVGLSSFNQDSIARNDCKNLASVNQSNIGTQQVYTLQ